MAKSVFRVLTIRNIFVGKDKEDKMAKQNQQRTPEPPRMVWKNGQPCYAHLEGEQAKPVHRQNIDPKQLKVPPMPKFRWNRDGSPDFSHLEEGSP